jgi:hypothetical protein
VSEPAEPIGGGGADVRLAVGERRDDAFLLAGQPRQRALGQRAFGLAAAERYLEQHRHPRRRRLGEGRDRDEARGARG